METVVSRTRESLGEELRGVRLSPVEQANLHLINDPALHGYRLEGRARQEDPIKGDGTGPVLGGGEEDPTLLGRVVSDHIIIGPEIERIAMGPQGPTALKSVSIHPDNHRFWTDGQGLYSADGTTLIRLMVPCETYEVHEGCTAIGDRAFDSMDRLSSVRLPDTLTTIGRLAFAKTSIAFLDASPSVEVVGEKAFFCCDALKAVLFSEALTSLGESAFAYSGLERLRIPEHVEHIGHGCIEHTPAQASFGAGTVSIEPANRRYWLDQHGGLYHDGDLAEILSRTAQYAVHPGCGKILEGACRRNLHLRCVSLPESVYAVEANAFRGCRSLAVMSLPEGLESIGAGAFMDTKVEELRLGAEVAFIGEGALLVQGESATRERHPLRKVDLDSANLHFYLEGGMLCQRGAGNDGADMVVLYVGPEAIVRIPEAVNRIAPFAFFGATDIEELYVHGHMHSICRGALSVARSIPRIHVTLGEEREGAKGSEGSAERICVDLPTPQLSSRYRTFSDLFSTNPQGTVFVFPYYDAWVTNTAPIDEFAPAALARLRDPLFLPEETREVYEKIMGRKQLQLCEHFAHKGDLEALTDLVAWGILDPATIEKATARATEKGDAQATACLLELGHRHGIAPRLDLSI